MALPISRNQTVRFVPSGHTEAARAAAQAAGEADLRRFDHPAAYIVTVPSVLERAAWRRDLTATGAQFYSDEDLLGELRRQVAAALEEGDPEREAMLGTIDDFRALPDRGKAPAELAAEIERLEKIIRGASTDYAEMLAARSYWIEVAPVLACRHFLRARENPDHVFQRRHGLVLDSEIALVPDAELMEVGYHIISLMSPSKAQEKNSGSSSPSPADPTTTPAESGPRTEADGTSTGSSTSETPASS